MDKNPGHTGTLRRSSAPKMGSVSRHLKDAVGALLRGEFV